MPDHPRGDRSPADDGLYLVPYWVQGGRSWFVILAALLGGGAILLSLAAWFERRGFSSGFGYGAAATVCSLVRPDHRHFASSDVGLGQSMNGVHPCRS